MNKIRTLLSFIILFQFFILSAYDGEKPQNRFNVNLKYSQTSGFIPSIDFLWHYNEKFFSGLYADYFVSSEKNTLEKYENSKYAVFSKEFVVGSEIFGFYIEKKPALFSLSIAFEYKRTKNDEFGFFDIGKDQTVTFDDTILLNMLFPYLKFRIDKYSEQIDNRFILAFYPTYCLLLEQEIFFKPLTAKGYKSNSSKWQIPAVELSDELLFKFKKFGAVQLAANFAFWQAKYESAVLRQNKDTYYYGKADVKMSFIEYSVAMSYIIPFEIAGTVRPKIGIGLDGSAEFRVNGQTESTHKDIGYLLIFGFYY